MNNPSQESWYLMQLAAMTKSAASGESVSVAEQKLTFGGGEEEPVNEEEQLRFNTAVILAVAGVGATQGA